MVEIVAVLAAGIVLGAVLCAAMYEKELRRMARLLRARSPESNVRVTVDIPGRGARELARSVNAHLDRMQDERIADIRRRQDFQRGLSALSHDVRTPIAGAKGRVQLALDDCDEASRARHLAAAQTRLDDASALLDGLFAYTRSADPDLVLRRDSVRVMDALAGSLQGFLPRFDERGWEPQVSFEDEEIAVAGDAEALSRIFDNLLQNALRHGAGEMRIEQRGRTVAFSNRVAAPKGLDASRLFERFYRADVSRGAAGSGLGLASARNLARAMGMDMAARLEGDVLFVELLLSGGSEKPSAWR